MKKFTEHRGIALPFVRHNVDTDQIIPSREMKKVAKTGLAEGLFSGERYLYDNNTRAGENPDFPLNQSAYRSSTILIGGDNFGCGSSREHAVWALVEYGFRAIIAVSFAPIFYDNCLRNGLLPISIEKNEIDKIVKQLEQASDKSLFIDLPNQTISSPTNTHFHFDTEDYCKDMLLNGWDFIDLALKYEEQIDGFIESDRKKRSWAYL